MPRGATETRPCAACGTPLTRLVSQARGRFWYCDHRCQAAHAPARVTLSREENPHRGRQETRPCAYCGEPVTRYLNRKNLPKVWFCSMQHRALVQSRERVEQGTWIRPQKPRRGDTIPCDWCGEPFYRHPYEVRRNSRYCSVAHWNEAQRVNQVAKVCAYCGEPFSVPKSQSARQFCKKRCEADGKIKRPTGRMHNGRPVIEDYFGYLTIYEPEHPAADKTGRVREHRWVVEQSIGRYLTPDEQVDHINAIKTDNRLENLQVLSASVHARKTNAENLGALPVLRQKQQSLEERLAEYERRFGPLP